MSIIKPRTRGKQFEPCRLRLERENHETVHAYAAFIGEDVEYVINAVIDTVLAKDKAFAAWRADHAQSFVPPASAVPTTVRRGARASIGTGSVATTAESVASEARHRSVEGT